jgi:hypothetical protein
VVRRLDRAPRLDGTDHLEQLRRRQLGHWHLADPREDVVLEAGDDLVVVTACPAVLAHGVPLAGDLFERATRRQPVGDTLLVLVRLDLRLPFGLALLAGVEPFRQEPPRRIGLAARDGQPKR